MIRRDYLIVGAGVAGASACEGIREYDPKGSVMLVGAETIPPYHRPMLFKHGLNGKHPKPETVCQHDAAWYDKHKIDFRLDTLVTHFNVERHLAVLSNGQSIEFRKACLATGARARRPQVAGQTLGNVIYLRTWRDMLALREMADLERDVAVIGGGFVAAEAATLLSQRGRPRVTLIHRGRALWDKKLDAETAEWLTQRFRDSGIKLMLGETINGFEGRTVLKNVQTKSGQRLASDLAVVAIGCDPNLALVAETPLSYPHGTPVNEYLETDEKGIYAAGDIAAYPCKILGGIRRFEYWECAMAQGRVCGANMTGKKRMKFEYVPHCSAHALEYHFDLVGDFSKPPTRFTLEGDRAKGKFTAHYYQPNGLIGILLCNQPADKVEAAKEELRTAPRGKLREVI
jgi:NADPH-dependent 2,4-dienoyl-CoA reductase/sulfur reductase-like enzyme